MRIFSIGSRVFSWCVLAAGLFSFGFFVLVVCAAERDVLLDGSSGERVKNPLIGMVLQNLENPIYQDLEINARQFCLGRGQCRVASGGSLGYQEGNTQRVWLKQLIEERVDALIVSPSVGRELIPQLVQAKKRGIPVVNIGGRFDAEQLARNRLIIPWVGPDNTAAARAIAQLLVQRLPPASKVAILAGAPGHYASYDRIRAARSWLKSKKINVVAVETAHWQKDCAELVTQNLLIRFPDLGAVIAINDEMALGALRAVDLVKPGKVLITGFDGHPQVLDFIRSGKILATVDWYPDRIGIYAIEKLLSGVPGDRKTPWRLLVKEDLMATGKAGGPIH